MENKKGFTLVEIIAVIALLGVIMLIVVPNVTKSLKEGKISAFTNQVQMVVKTAEEQHAVALASKNIDNDYCDKYSTLKDCTQLKTGKEGIQYYVTFNKEGKISYVAVADGKYCYIKENPTSQEVNEEEVIKGSLVCSGNESCVCDGTAAFNPEEENSGGGSSSGGTKSYTVSVDCTNCTSDQTSKKVKKGSNVSFLLNPANKYTLDGATVEEDECVLDGNTLTVSNVKENITCHVSAVKNTYKLSLICNNCSADTNVIEVVKNEAGVINLTPNYGYTLEGEDVSVYTVIGDDWDSEGVCHLEGNQLIVNEMTANTKCEVNARKNRFSITLSLANGTTNDETTFDLLETDTKVINVSVNEGYNINKYSASSLYNEADVEFDPNTGKLYISNPGYDTTIYLSFRKNEVIITYDANGGINPPSPTSSYDSGQSDTSIGLSSTKPTRFGYTFMGWSDTPTGAVKYLQHYLNSNSYTYNFGTSQTIYAVWEQTKMTALNVEYRPWQRYYDTYAWAKVTVPETGYYTIRSIYTDAVGSLYDENEHLVASSTGSFKISTTLEAGKEYYLRTKNSSTFTTGSIRVQIECAQPPLDSVEYVYWNQGGSYSYYMPNKLPSSNYYASTICLSSSTRYKYVKTKIENSAPVNHELCVAIDTGAVICVDKDYFDTDLTTTKNKLQAEYTSLVDPTKISCSITNSDSTGEPYYASCRYNSSREIRIYYNKNIYTGCNLRYETGEASCY